MLEDAIREVLDRTGLALDEDQVRALIAHAEMLLEANADRNLTRISEPADVALLHVGDSLAALPYLAEAPSGRFADLGSGGGYPGIPLAVVSSRPATLVESRGGKAAFLSRVVDALGLDADVRNMRAEELAAVEPGMFVAVTARALTALPSLVELASPLLAVGGILIALKGDPDAEEVDRGDDVAAKVGMRRRKCERVRLETDLRRTIVTYERVGASSIRLPRRPGMAQRHPLA